MKSIRVQIEEAQGNDIKVDSNGWPIVITVAKDHYKPLGFIKDLVIKATGVTYSLTKDIRHADKFTSDMSCMLYHHLKDLSNIEHTSHYSVNL